MALPEWLGGRPWVKDVQGWWEADASMRTTWRGQRLDWENQLWEQNMASSAYTLPPPVTLESAKQKTKNVAGEQSALGQKGDMKSSPLFPETFQPAISP